MNRSNVVVLDSPASTSSSTLIFNITNPNDAKSVSGEDSPNSNAGTPPTHVSRKPKLTVSTTTSTSPLPTRMSGKGFIEPHRSHLPRRVNQRTRTKTPPSLSLELVTRTLELEAGDVAAPSGDVESNGRHFAQVDSVQVTETTVLQSPSSSGTPQSGIQNKGFIQPHRNNLPRRVKSTTYPIANPRTKGRPLLSAVDSQSTIHDTYPTISTSLSQPEQQLSSPSPSVPTLTPIRAPLSFLLPDAASTLITQAQAKVKGKARQLEKDDDDVQGEQEPKSPDLPHPAMGLTMGIMEAVAAAAAAREQERKTNQTPGRSATVTPLPDPSPALGVVGSATTLGHSNAATSPPLPLPVEPKSAPLGRNLPRRHRRGRELNSRRGSLTRKTERLSAEKQGEAENKVLRFERVTSLPRRAAAGVGEEEEDGLFSSLLDFSNGSGARRERRQRTQERQQQQQAQFAHVHRALSAPATSGRRSIPAQEAGKSTSDFERKRCGQVLGRSRVEVGFLVNDDDDELEDDEEGEGMAYVLLRAIDDDSPDDDEVGGHPRTLKLTLPTEKSAYKEGIPSLLAEQIRQGCEFMRAWIGGLGVIYPEDDDDDDHAHIQEDRGQGDTAKTRIQILTPRWRPEEAMGLALCYLVWAEARELRRSCEEDRTSVDVSQHLPLPSDGAQGLPVDVVDPQHHHSHSQVVPFGVNDLGYTSTTTTIESTTDMRADVDDPTPVSVQEESNTPPHPPPLAASTSQEEKQRPTPTDAADYSVSPPAPSSNDCFPSPDVHLYTPIHLLYMRLLDDDKQGEWRGRRRASLTRAGGKKAIGLGILGIDEIDSDKQEGDERTSGGSNTDTAGSSFPFDQEKKEEEEEAEVRGRTVSRSQHPIVKGLHVREAAFGGRELLDNPRSIERRERRKETRRRRRRRQPWVGLSEEWRGVLSFQGLKELDGVMWFPS